MQRVLAAILIAMLSMPIQSSPSHAGMAGRIGKIALGAAAADWAVVAGAAFVETNLALRSAHLGSIAVSGLSRLLAAHRILGPRAVYISLAKRIIEDPSLFGRAVQVANMIGLEQNLVERRIQELVDTGGADPDPEDECTPSRDGPYQPRQMADGFGLRYQGPSGLPDHLGGSGPVVQSDTVPPLGKPNVTAAAASPSGLVVGVVPFDVRGLPIFDKFALADLRVVDRAAFFAKGVTSDEQMRLATLELRKILLEEKAYTGLHAEQVAKGAVGYTKKFTPNQVDAIMKGRIRIPDLTWHHHQDPARMQLVPTKTHQSARHVGGWWLNRCRIK